MAGDFRVAIAVIDVDEEMGRRQHVANALHEIDDVGPCDEADVGQAVVASGEAEAA